MSSTINQRADRTPADVPMPSAEDLTAARNAFEEKEPRDLFYRVATALVDLAMDRKTSFSLSEALALLLQTWNAMHYRFHPFDREHFADIERLLGTHSDAIQTFRQRTIQDLADADEPAVTALFNDFEMVLWPVGAAKTLHLLAPSFFPLWDREIARSYHLPLRERGRNAGRYWRFMRITRQQCQRLAHAQISAPNILKALDEYNYCVLTKGWM